MLCFLTSSALETYAWACLLVRSESESNSPLKCVAKMGKRQLFTEKHRVSHLSWSVADCTSVSQSSVNINRFFSLNLLSVFLLWGRVGMKDGIIAGKMLYFCSKLPGSRSSIC